MQSRESMLREMGVHFTDIARWAVDADDFEIMVVLEELAKLATHLETSRIVQDANKPKDMIVDA